MVYCLRENPLPLPPSPCPWCKFYTAVDWNHTFLWNHTKLRTIINTSPLCMLCPANSAGATAVDSPRSQLSAASFHANGEVIVNRNRGVLSALPPVNTDFSGKWKILLNIFPRPFLETLGACVPKELLNLHNSHPLASTHIKQDAAYYKRRVPLGSKCV